MYSPATSAEERGEHVHRDATRDRGGLAQDRTDRHSQIRESAKVSVLEHRREPLFIEATNDAESSTSGIVAMDRNRVFVALAGLGTTPLNATQLTSGTVDSARLGRCDASREATTARRSRRPPSCRASPPTSGFWTPIITADGGASGQVYAQQQGNWIKIGKSIIVQFQVVLSTKGTLDLASFRSGLPAVLGVQSAGRVHRSDVARARDQLHRAIGCQVGGAAGGSPAPGPGLRRPPTALTNPR